MQIKKRKPFIQGRVFVYISTFSKFRLLIELNVLYNKQIKYIFIYTKTINGMVFFLPIYNIPIKMKLMISGKSILSDNEEPFRINLKLNRNNNNK